MKKVLILFVAFFAIASIGFAQNADFKTAKKSMKKYEKQIIKKGTDTEGIKLINAAKEAVAAANKYVEAADGFADVPADDKKAKKQFARQLRKSDSGYAAQLKEIKGLNEAKVAYFSNINPEYKAAAELLASKKKKGKKAKKAKKG